jgi:hypothetical protein
MPDQPVVTSSPCVSRDGKSRHDATGQSRIGAVTPQRRLLVTLEQPREPPAPQASRTTAHGRKEGATGEPVGERLYARILCHPEPRANREGIALLRRAAANKAIDHLDTPEVALPGQPAEHSLRGGERLRAARRDAELDQRDEPPIPRPLLVRMAAKAAVRPLAAQKRTGKRSREDRLRIGFDGFTEDISARQISNRGLTRPKQPLDC